MKFLGKIMHKRKRKTNCTIITSIPHRIFCTLSSYFKTLRILHRKWLKNNNNITTLTVFSVLFRWSFLENNAQEKKKKKLHHCHIIFMVYNLTDQSAWSLLFYCTIIWDLQYMRSTIVLQGGIFRLFNFLQPPSHTISLNKEKIVSLLCIKFCLFIHCHHFIRQTKHFQRQHSLWGLPWI